MQKASDLFNEEQRKRIEQTIAEAETKTSSEIVPVVATASGRYDRPEDMVGLWFAITTIIAIWFLLPRHSSETGNWLETTPLYIEFFTLVIGAIIAFIAGATMASKIGWLRRLFTPGKQIKEEVSARARQVFFDKRIHHTTGATGLLIYVSLFEHVAMVLGDKEILDHENLGQPFLDQLCKQLTESFKKNSPTEALCETIIQAGEQLAIALPRQANDVNELSDALIIID